MKKMIITLTALFALCEGAAAQSVSATEMEALPGETVSLTMMIDTDGGSYTGLEFDIQFPAVGFTTTGKAANKVDDWDGSYTIGDVGGVNIDNLARCAVLSYTDTTIPGEGLQTFGTVEFTVGTDVPLGDYTVELKNMTLIGDGRFPIESATFTLHVVNVHTIVLDETSPDPIADATGVNVKVKRTIKAGEWSTICLPFDMTEEQVKTAFGNDVEIGDFVGAESSSDDDGNIVGINVNFNDATAIEANHPYIIKVALENDMEEFNVNGVNITPTDELSVDMDETRVKIGSKWFTFYNSFIGTYAANTEVPENSLFISGNKFWYSTGKTKMNGFRAYFDFYDVLTSVAGGEAARISMTFSHDGVVTAISGKGIVESEESAIDIYDLQGRKVSKPRKGLYVKDGKKLFVK